jgi:glyoxylase-like metal-dependent hydrolase (beta-lactamase superfamily II)
VKIVDNIFVIPGVVANPYLILDADGLTLIDAGIPGSEKKILAYIGSLGKSPRDLKRIILTHADLDHVGSLAALHEATGARTYAGQIEAAAIAAGKSSRPIKPSGLSLRRVMLAVLGPFMKPKSFNVDEILEDGQVLPVGRAVLRRFNGHRRGRHSRLTPKIHMGRSHGERSGEEAGRPRRAYRVLRPRARRDGCHWQIPELMPAPGAALNLP